MRYASDQAFCSKHCRARASVCGFAIWLVENRSSLGNYDWLDLPIPTHNAFPIHDRGIVASCPGLYSVGLLFLYSLSSVLVGGVGRDAGHIVEHIAGHRAAYPAT
jgi:hypothetical protein